MCTSFATYFQEPLCAQNIAHPNRERKFKITKIKCDTCNLKNSDIIRFHCQNQENDRFLDLSCMNSLGMFSNYQFLVPNDTVPIPRPKSKKLSAGNLFIQSQMYMGNVSELLHRIDGNTVYYNNSFGEFKLHNMFADKNG